MEFRLLGPLEVHAAGGPLPLGPPKQRTLLALLLMRANEVVSRDVAIDTVWGEGPPERAANALQVYVHGLRKVLGQERIERRGAGYALHAEHDEVDVLRFERLFEQGRAALAANTPAAAEQRFADALALWRGEPLADLPGDALSDERGRLAELRLHSLELDIDARLTLGRQDELIAELETLVAGNPFRERFRAQQMLALYRAGRQAEALQAFQAARRTLSDELGLEPSLVLSELERAILRHDPSLRLAERRPELRLPQPRTPTVGRALDVAAVTARLRDADTRLLTLTGAGGIGKTRLAVEAAADLGSTLADGAFFVDLAPVADPAQVAPAIAAMLEVAGEDRQPALEAVVATLRGLEAVLVLDNFERLLASANVVARILDGAPRIRILVTSRTPLRLTGEQEYAVQPLATPMGHEGFEALARNDSVAVFVSRAHAADRAFRFDDDNADDVAAVCRALEGLPLALELAAARVKLLTAAQIRERLEYPLDVLTGGSRDLPERQQALRATIDWSYDLLAEGAQRLLAELSVFAGGCTLDAAEAVCDAELEALTSLLDNSLLRRSEALGSEPRFRMLDAVREYATERLGKVAADPVRERHAGYYASLAERIAPDLRGPGMTAAFAALSAERDNLLAALTHALAHDREVGFRIVSALRPLATAAREREVVDWLEAAFREQPEASTSAQVGALVVLGRHHMIAGRYEDSREVLARAVRGGRRFDCSSDAAAASTYLAWLSLTAGDYDEGRRLAEEGIVLARRGSDLWAERQGLAMVAGALINDGKVEAARPYLDRSLELAGRLDDPATTVIALVNSGYGTICTGDLKRARADLERALAVARKLDQLAAIVSALLPLAWQANAANEPERARALLAEALEILQEEAHHMYRVDALTEVAVTLADTEPAAAARFLGAAEAGSDVAGVRRPPPMGKRVDAVRQRLAESLGDERLAELLAEGARLDLAQAVSDAHAALCLTST
jgi:predicted ATPase/DNA-binding SARP family transcriptional activator